MQDLVTVAARRAGHCQAHLRLALLCALVAPLGITACSGGGEEPAAPTAPAPPPPSPPPPPPGPAPNICVSGATAIRSASDLDQIRNNLAGAYCLGNDIDLSTLANWTPIGDQARPFTGTFSGSSCSNANDPNTCKIYALRNLRITADSGPIGLFGSTRGASIADLAILDANIRVTLATQNAFAEVGILLGTAELGTVQRVFVTGKVSITASGADAGTSAGGLIGSTSGTVSQSFSYADVSVTGGINSGGIGGLVGSACCAKISAASRVSESYATGQVTASGVAARNIAAGVGGLIGSNGAAVVSSFATGDVTSDTGTFTGGLIGFAAWDAGSVRQSFATGNVTAGAASKVGGLIGWIYDVPVSHSYSTGKVTAGDLATAGGFAGQSGGGCMPCSASVQQSYSTGQLVFGNSTTAGGFLGVNGSDSTITTSYWDTQSSGLSTSAGGSGVSGRPTADFRSTSLPGFDAAIWSNSSGTSPPYLVSNNNWIPPATSTNRNLIPARSVSYRSPLSVALIGSGRSNAFPIGQLQQWQYATFRLADASTACKAAVYTMIARTVGQISPNLSISSVPLRQVPIDRFLDSQGFAVWPTTNVDLSSRVIFRAGNVIVQNPLDSTAAPFDRSAIASELAQGRLVLLRGCTTDTGRCDDLDSTYKHWILVTVALRDSNGEMVGLVANDPETGQQVIVDMAPLSSTFRQIVTPDYSTAALANFRFTANWYYSAELR